MSSPWRKFLWRFLVFAVISGMLGFGAYRIAGRIGYIYYGPLPLWARYAVWDAAKAAVLILAPLMLLRPAAEITAARKRGNKT